MKTFQFFNNENELDYFITEDNTDAGVLYTLTRSEGAQWSSDVKGDKILSILDDGNGLILNRKIGKSLDYSWAGELTLLLTFIQKRSAFFSGRVEESTPFFKL